MREVKLTKRIDHSTKKALNKTEKFLAAVESAAIDVARREGWEIRTERDSRGRYPTFTLRLVGEKVTSDKVVRERYVDGVKIKVH